jgi:hypothetical protein
MATKLGIQYFIITCLHLLSEFRENILLIAMDVDVFVCACRGRILFSLCCVPNDSEASLAFYLESTGEESIVKSISYCTLSVIVLSVTRKGFCFIPG